MKRAVETAKIFTKGKKKLNLDKRLPGSIFSPYTSIATNILFFDKTGPTKETCSID